jgi:DNA polymerase beta
MVEHETFLREFFLELVPEFSITVVGSYRRGETSSGDVDILLTYNGLTNNQANAKFEYCINKLLEYDYIIGSLAKGNTKFLGICKLKEKLPARRIDILLTRPDEFACALLYFTGSKNFNVNFRKVAILKGYTLNEHRLKKTDEKSDSPSVPSFKTEKDVFKFLGIVYQEPHQRVGPVQMVLPVSMI